MSILERFPIPKRLSARLWLITLPSAVVSFERRAGVPRLSLGRLRYAGVPLVVAGAVLFLLGARRPDASLSYPRALSRLPRRPATAGGILALTGVAFVLQSWMLCLYAAGITFASGSEDGIEIEEPEPSMFLGGGGD